MEKYYNIKTNRIFTPVRKHAWIFIPVVAVGGLWYPKLGLLIIPMMLALMVTGFFKGRYWCGNICPHGSLFDRFIMPFSLNKQFPKFFKSKIVISLMFVWFMYMFGKRIYSVSRIWGTVSFLDKFGFIFVVNYLITTVLGTAFSLLIAPRSWCKVCPMGTIQGLSYKAAKKTNSNIKTDELVTVEAVEKCQSCAKCARVCPMQLDPYLSFNPETNQIEDERCIKCGTCVYNCGSNLLSLATKDNAERITTEADLSGFEHRQVIKAVISSVKTLKDDTIEYTFSFITPEKIDYKAGQFIMVRIKEEPVMYRSYTISSFNEDGRSLSITVKKVNKGYGTHIIFDQFKLGDKVTLEGPLGHELIVDKQAENLLFVAGGIGITPFIPLIKDIMQESGNVKKMTLVYGVNKEDEFLYEEQYKELESMCHRLELIKVVANDENWAGHKGFVTDVIKDLEVSDRKVYMCGPKPMIDATVKTLKQKNVPEKNIFAESA